LNIQIKNSEASTQPFWKAAVIGFSAAALMTLATSANATNLVANGSFTTTTGSASGGQLGYNVAATGWTSTGYNFLFTPGSADTTGVTGSDGNLKLWGPGDGSANGLPGTSPDGGNYVAADGAYEVGAISQTINGLTAGDTYAVSFYWAGAQQSGFTGLNTEQWDVSLGSQTLDTAVVDNTSHGFTGWQYETLDFTATGSNEVLSFLAVGTPSGEPPFSLLDGVSLNDVTPTPEPGSFPLLFTGLIGGLGVLRSRKWLKR
jgi:hypothetical protein